MIWGDRIPFEAARNWIWGADGPSSVGRSSASAGCSWSPLLRAGRWRVYGPRTACGSELRGLHCLPNCEIDSSSWILRHLPIQDVPSLVVSRVYEFEKCLQNLSEDQKNHWECCRNPSEALQSPGIARGCRTRAPGCRMQVVFGRCFAGTPPPVGLGRGCQEGSPDSQTVRL